MLHGSNRPTEPSVVTDVDNDIGPCGVGCHHARINDFVTDRDGYLETSRDGQCLLFWSPARCRHGKIKKRDDASQNSLERDKFAERYQFPFDVSPRTIADDNGSVVVNVAVFRDAF